MRFSLIQPLRDIPVVFVDVETTGASAEYGHRVTELGIVRVERGEVVAEYGELVDPKRKIDAGVVRLTGITQEMVDGLPTFQDRLPEIEKLMAGAVVVGHNVRFDLSFIAMEFRRGQRDFKRQLAGADGADVHVLDTVRIARRRFGRGGNGLQRLAPRLGVAPATAHRALADAQTTHRVFEKLLEPAGGWATCLCDAMSAQGGPMGLLPLNAKESVLPLELQEALEQRGSVVMEYLDAGQRATRRVIDPIEIRRRNGELILIAHCQLRADRRTFKVDRIVRLQRLNEAIESAPLFASVAATADAPVDVPCDAPVDGEQDP